MSYRKSEKELNTRIDIKLMTEGFVDNLDTNVDRWTSVTFHF